MPHRLLRDGERRLPSRLEAAASASALFPFGQKFVMYQGTFEGESCVVLDVSAGPNAYTLWKRIMEVPVLPSGTELGSASGARAVAVAMHEYA